MMNEDRMPLVSVIMPAYNAAAFVEPAIRSVMNQTHSHWELLVIDDGSRDQTLEIVKALASQDPRIRLHVNDENMGTARTRNRGLDLCAGEYAAFLDSDDIWRPDKLEKQVALAKAEGADIVYSSYAIIDQHDSRSCEDFIVPSHTDVDQMLKKNVIGCSTVMLSRRAVAEFRFNPEFYHEDYVLWLEMLRAGKKAVGVEQVLVDYRFHSSGRASNKIASARRRWHIYRSYMGLSVARSLYYLIHYAIHGVIKYH